MRLQLPYRLLTLREDINGKKRFLSGIARMRGGHFWSLKRVYFFKNANVLNLELFFRLLTYLPPLPTFLQTFFCDFQILNFDVRKKDQVARIGVRGGGWG